jgi:hypothetical protein
MKSATFCEQLFIMLVPDPPANKFQWLKEHRLLPILTVTFMFPNRSVTIFLCSIHSSFLRSFMRSSQCSTDGFDIAIKHNALKHRQPKGCFGGSCHALDGWVPSTAGLGDGTGGTLGYTVASVILDMSGMVENSMWHVYVLQQHGVWLDQSPGTETRGGRKRAVSDQSRERQNCA